MKKIEAKKEKLAKNMAKTPTGQNVRIGSQKHQYWEDIKRRGKENKKYGSGD